MYESCLSLLSGILIEFTCLFGWLVWMSVGFAECLLMWPPGLLVLEFRWCQCWTMGVVTNIRPDGRKQRASKKRPQPAMGDKCNCTAVVRFILAWKPTKNRGWPSLVGVYAFSQQYSIRNLRSEARSGPLWSKRRTPPSQLRERRHRKLHQFCSYAPGKRP